MENVIKQIMTLINNAEANPETVGKLPGNSYFLNDKYIVCKPRKYGVSRYPYYNDGLSIWVSSNGHITADEGAFTLFRPSYTDEVPCIGFFFGIKQDDGTYYPISVNEGFRPLYEAYKVNRYTVYSPEAAYYIADLEDYTFATRIYVGKDKKINFTHTAINKTDSAKPIYIATFFEAILRFSATEADSCFTRCARFGEHFENGNFLLRNPNRTQNSIAVNTKISGPVTKRNYTTARRDILGISGRNYGTAECLKTGEFEINAPVTRRSDLPNVGDITHFEIGPNDTARIDYSITLFYEYDKAVETALDNTEINAKNMELEVEEIGEKLHNELSTMQINFGDWKIGKNSSDVVNHFLRTVQHQVSFCAFGKNYAGALLGMRDVSQQLEAALMWEPKTSKACILRAFSYIDVNGRPPRQFTVMPSFTQPADLDQRCFIDQGIWMIDMVYTYLAYTDDYSILDEECGYFILNSLGYATTRCSDKRDSLLNHILLVYNFLKSNIDDVYGTNCLRILFGDWNDAIDGLGHTEDKDKDFGYGVSIMATLQFYRNLNQLSKIFAKVGGYDDKIKECAELREKIKEGFFKYAVQTNDKGEHRIVHGWGDKLSYYVGSFKDTDGADRISFASNAFYAISGLIDDDASLKETAIKDLKSLDSKYGLRTLWPAFPPDMKGVGRIVNTVPGTAENACAYVHASIFSIAGLFLMGESEFAWRQLEKSIVISHDNPSLSTFAMPNSYFDNEELCMDGESGGDWYTGSGTTLIKAIVGQGFGIRPDLEGLKVEMPMFMPSDNASISIKVKGSNVKVNYENKSNGNRKYLINGVEAATEINPVTGAPMIYIKKADFTDNMNITVID